MIYTYLLRFHQSQDQHVDSHIAFTMQYISLQEIMPGFYMHVGVQDPNTVVHFMSIPASPLPDTMLSEITFLKVFQKFVLSVCFQTPSE